MEPIMYRPLAAFVASLLISTLPPTSVAAATSEADANPFTIEVVADLHEPWAMAFLPDGQLLITEKKGSLQLLNPDDGSMRSVAGMPNVDYGGQGGLGDVALHPQFAQNNLVYLSYVEAGTGNTRGAAVARGTLDTTGRRPVLSNVEVIWRQYPKVLGRGHYGHRLTFDAEGLLWVTSGDRQKFTPAQDMQTNLGKVLRLTDDGKPVSGNPFMNWLQQEPLVDDEAVYDEIWSLGHRNPLGFAFDLQGNPWVIEMGPAGGDELNKVQRGANYGYPVVSDGNHYDGRPIPNHSTRPDFEAPAISWTPVISPGDLTVLKGTAFTEWRGQALVAGLSSEAIVRIALSGGSDRDAAKDGGKHTAKEVARYPMGARIRSVREGPDGSLWVLEDERRSSTGRLLRLTPREP